MTLSSAEIIDIVFIPVYALTLALTLHGLVKHSRGKRFAYVSLLILSVVRLVSNIILVVGYETGRKAHPNENTVQSLFIAGFILQSIGYSFLYASALAFVVSWSMCTETSLNDPTQNRAILYDKKQETKEEKKFSPSRLLHVLNTVATICLIVGMSQSTDAFSTTSTDRAISSPANVGAIIYCVGTGLLGLLVIYHLFIMGSVTPSARVILQFVAVALIFMLVRAIYTTFRVSSSDFLNYNTWAHLVCQYLVEVIAIFILLGMGHVLVARGGDSDLDERKAYNDAMKQDYGHNVEQAI